VFQSKDNPQKYKVVERYVDQAALMRKCKFGAFPGEWSKWHMYGSGSAICSFLDGSSSPAFCGKF